MSEQDTSGINNESLINLLSRVEAAENPEEFLLKLTIERVRQEDAELAEAIWYCAIPRRFDANVIGVLRDGPEDRELNERLLTGLLAHDFVLARQDGGYVYHDNTRDTLLEQWRSDHDERPRFDLYNQRLVAFYESQHEKDYKIEQDLEAVAKVLRKANPSRYTQLASIVEKRVVMPLLEVLYHQTLRSAQLGYELFTEYFQDYEERDRLTVCESLLNATRDCMRRLPPENEREPLLRWLESWEARLMLGLHRFADSEEVLRGLLTRVEGDAKLKLWVLGDLGRLQQRRSNLREARKTYEAALELAEETPEDAYNLPVRYSNLASVFWDLSDLDRAAELYRAAIRSAQENNSSLEASSRADLSGVLQARGEWAQALDLALEALHLSRTRLLPDRIVHRSVLQRFMFLFGRRAPRLLDTLFAEYSALLTALGDPLETISSRLRYADLLQDAGQLERAENLIAGLRNGIGEYADTSFDVSLLFSEASLCEYRGHLDEAIALYTRIIGHAHGGLATPWEHASALSNRGLRYAGGGCWAEAEGDFRAALAKWHEIGHEKMVAYVRVLQADALRRQGRLDEAQEALYEAWLPLEETNTTYQASWHRVQGDVYRARARWEETHEQYQTAMAIRQTLDLTALAAEDSADMAASSGARGRWEQGARHATDSAELWRQLCESALYRPSGEAKAADRENRRGAECFLAIGGEDRERVGRARDFFRSATEQSPDNIWYWLNVAYASAALEEWEEAARSIDAALERGPEWLRTPALYEQLVEYGFNQGQALFVEGNYEGAVRTYAEYLRRAESYVRPELLTAGWLGLGDSSLTLGRTDQAKAQYTSGLSLAENTVDRAVFSARLACAAAAEGDLSEVVKHVRSSLRLQAEAGRSDGALDLVRGWAPVITSIRQHRFVGEALRVLTYETDSDGGQRRDLVSARLELSLSRPMEHAAEVDPEALTPFVRPIVLEADDRLFPQAGETPQVIRMIETDIPSMRERIRTSMGVTVPGVHVRGNAEYEEGLYVFRLHGLIFAGGTVPFGEKYCPDAAGCLALGIEGQVISPFEDEAEGMWLPESDRARAEQAGLPLLDPYEYMLSHLEAIIRRQLATFLGFQEVRSLLEIWTWEGDQDRQELVDAVLSDEAAIGRLVQVLQGLVREAVPVRDLTSILSTYAEASSQDEGVIEIIERARMALLPELPGNRDGQRLILLSPDFEVAIARWVWERDSKQFLALPLEEAGGLIGDLREHLGGRPVRNLTLIVQDSRLRPFVRRIVETEFPSLPVLSEREWMGEQAKDTEEIEYTGPSAAADD